MKNRANAVDALIGKKFPLVKIRRNSKKPLQLGWEAKWRTEWEAEDFADCNVGIQMGRGLFVLDIDVKALPDGQSINGYAILEEWESLHGRLPETVSANTPGGGRHFYFKGNLGTRKFMRDGKFSGVEVRGDGSQVLAHPSSIDGKAYEWLVDQAPDECEIAEAPAWLLALFQTQERAERRVRTFAGDDSEPVDIDELARMVAFLDPVCDYETWLHVGMALHSTGHEKAFALWDAWSAGGGSKYPGTDALRHKWGSFKRQEGVGLGTLYHIVAQVLPDVDFGIPEDERADPAMAVIESLPSDPTSTKAWAEVIHIARLESSTTAQDDAMRTVLSHMRGTLRLVYDDVLQAAFVPVPEFALATAISIMSGLCQKRFQLQNGNKLSLYTIIAGLPGSGKNDYMNYAIEAVDAVDKSCRMRSEPRSDPGLRALLLKAAPRSALFYVRDEWGLDLKAAFLGRGDSHYTEVIKLMLRLFGHVKVLEGQERAKKEDSTKEVKDPHLALLGSMTMPQLLQLYACDMFTETGFSRRCDIYRGNGEHPEYKPERVRCSVSGEAQKALKNVLKTFEGFQVEETATIVGISSSAHPVFRAFWERVTARAGRDSDDTRDVTLATAWSTMREKIERYAGLHAVGRGSLFVEAEDAHFGVALGNLLLLTTEGVVERSMEHSLDRVVAAVLAFLGRNKGKASVRDLFNGVRAYKSCKPQDRQLVHTMLEQQPMVERKVSRGRGGEKLEFHLRGC